MIHGIALGRMIIDDPPRSYVACPETDAELRERLQYVSGDGPALQQRISMMSGQQLEDFAATLNLKRRTT